MTAQALQEVEAAMRQLSGSDKSEKWLAKNYVGAGLSKLEFLDVKIPEVRQRFAKRFSFSDKSLESQWRTWDYIWKHSNTFETMLLALFWLEKQGTEDLVAHADLVLCWVKKIDNWAHSDGLSAQISKILEANHVKYLPIFDQWSHSKNPWLRRQSLVGLLYYSRLRKKTLAFSILKQFVDRQVEDKHFYVQKAVGWTLRECWNIYPDQTERYLEVIAERIPPAGWTAATEKLDKKTKNRLADLRKKRKSDKI